MPATERADFQARQEALLGVAVGVSATVLAVGGHALGGGETPSPSLLAAFTLAAIAASVVVSRTRWRLPALLGVLAAMQAVFHVALGGPAGSAAHAGHYAGHAHTTQSSAAGSATTGFGWQMLAAHMAAVLVTALVLRRGAQICRHLATALAAPFGTIRGLLRPVPKPSLSLPCHPATRPVSMCAQLVLCAAPLRGPPAALAI